MQQLAEPTTEMVEGGSKIKLVLHDRCPALNPFIPSGVFYLHASDRCISNIRDVLLDFIITIFYRNFCI